MYSQDFITASKSGNAYSWSAETADVGGGATILLVRNDSETHLLCIENIIAYCDVSSEIEIHVPTAAFTPSATVVVTGQCLNRYYDNDATAISTARANETANAQGDVVYRDYIVQALLSKDISFAGALKLNSNQSVGVDFVADTGVAYCNIIGYFVPKIANR